MSRSSFRHPGDRNGTIQCVSPLGDSRDMTVTVSLVIPSAGAMWGNKIWIGDTISCLPRIETGNDASCPAATAVLVHVHHMSWGNLQAEVAITALRQCS